MHMVLIVLLGALLAPAPAAQRPVAPRPALPAALQHSATATPGPVETEMRAVDLRSAPNVTLSIDYLRGYLQPTRAGMPPWLEDLESFVVAVDSAEIRVGAASLAALFNDYVMNYPGAPIAGLRVRVLGERLELTGRLHGVGFAMEAEPGVTGDGRLRMRPRAVKVVGIGVQSLMRRLGIELDDVMRVRRGRGVTVTDSSIVLDPGDLAPPPRLAGRLVAVRLSGNALRMVFGRSARGGAPPIDHPAPPGANYVCYHGGVLRFGKLRMGDAELEIADADPRDPLDLWPARFNRQLVAGATRNQPDFGLKTTLPDYADLPVQPAPR
jgi:hypothetical protein